MKVVQASGLAVLAALAGGLCSCQNAKTDATAVTREAVPRFAVIAAGAEHIFSDPNDSPVRVVGGSITARAKGGWDCTSSPCKSGNTEVDQFTLIGAVNPNQPLPAWSGITLNWKIEIFDRNQNEATNGIMICSAKDCSTGTALSSTSGPVFLQPEPSNSAFYATPAPQDDAKGDDGKRFQDTDTAGCTKMVTTNGTSYKSDQDFCEHMGRIVVTIGTSFTYNCPDGACKIEIGQ